VIILEQKLKSSQECSRSIKLMCVEKDLSISEIDADVLQQHLAVLMPYCGHPGSTLAHLKPQSSTSDGSPECKERPGEHPDWEGL
jgi:hypothetical protein